MQHHLIGFLEGVDILLHGLLIRLLLGGQRRQALVDHPIRQQLVFDAVDKDAGPLAGDVELALHHDVALVLPHPGLGILHQGGKSHQAAKHGHRHGEDISPQGDVGGQIGEAPKPGVIPPVKEVNLGRVLAAVEEIQPAEGKEKHHLAAKLPAEKRDGGAAVLPQEDEEGGGHIETQPPLGELDDEPLPPQGINLAEHRRVIKDQSQHRQRPGAPGEPPPPPQPGAHGVGQGQLHQKEGEKIPAHRQHVPQLPQGTHQVLHFRLDLGGEEEEELHLGGDAAFFGHIHQGSRPLNRQRGAEAQHQQRLPIAPGHRQHHTNGHQQEDQHQNHRFPPPKPA